MRTILLIALIIIIALFVLFGCSKAEVLSNNDFGMIDVKIKLDPLLARCIGKETNLFAYDLQIEIVNESDQILYIPNPEDSYMGNVALRFFLVCSSDQTIKSLVYPLTPILSAGTWRIFKARDSINLSRRINLIDSTVVAKTDSSSTEKLLNVETFRLDRETDTQYQLYVEFTYDGQHSRWHEKWLKLAALRQGKEELSRFWQGKVTSNRLHLPITVPDS